MEAEFEQAQNMRRSGDLEGARKILVRLCEQHPNVSKLQYSCAAVHDNLGLEKEAVPYYETALRLGGLQGPDLAGCYIGLGSTYRLLGEYKKSMEVLLEGSRAFPTTLALKVFEAMTLHEDGKHNLAIGLLIHCLIEKPGDPSITDYSRALLQYAQEYAKEPAE
ncbi:MAG TPA: tetratricopeptide repeat protein [Drouetiella sp.]